jgi:hypothetical protein
MENSTIIMETMRFFGKDYNIVKGYDLFKTIHKKDSSINSNEYRAMFCKGL